MAQGMERIPLAVGSDFKADPVRANFPDQAASDYKLVSFEPDQVQAQPATSTPRSMGTVAADTAYGMAKGAGSLAKGIGWLAGSDGLQQAGQTAEDYWGEKQSADLHRQLEEVGKAEGVTGTIAALGNNPGAIGDYIATSLPMMIPGMAVGNLGARGIVAYAGNAARGAALRSGATEAAAMQAGRIAAEKAAEKAAMRFAVGANMLGEGAVSGGVTGSEVEKFAVEHGATPEQAKASANKSALMAGVWTTAGAGIGAGMETRAMLGRLKDSGIKGIAKNISKEALEEAIQNPGEDYAAYAGKVPYDPTQTFDPGKAATLGAVTGGAMGAGFHAAGRAGTIMRGEREDDNTAGAIPASDIGAGPGGGGGISGDFIPASPLDPSRGLADQARTGNTYDQSRPELPPGQTMLPLPMLPAPEDGGPSERQVATARGLLNHSPKASPELLQRLMRVEPGTAVALFNHWQGLKNGEVTGNQGAEVSAQGSQGQSADDAGSGTLDGQRDGSMPSAMADSAGVAEQGGEPGMALGAAGPDAVTPLDVEAHGAATSPYNARPQPTEAQKQAGNYKVGRIKFQGMDISIENPAGSVRSGVDKDGKAWENTLQSHYGYIRGSTARDGDHVDVFIKPGAQTARTAYVIDQIDPKTGKYDEAKVILGANSEADAMAIYHANYADGWKGLGEITAMPIATFKGWVKSGKTKKPVAYVEPKEVRTAVRRPATASNLLQAIVNRGGINRSVMRDVYADPGARYMPGLFTNHGTADFGELAVRLFDEDGFHQIHQHSPEGPGRVLAELVGRALAGEKILSTEAMEKSMQADENAKLKEKAQRLGVKTVARKIEEIAAEVARIEEQSVLDEETRLEDDALVAYNESVDALNAAVGVDAAENFLEDLASRYQEETHLNYLRNATTALQEKLNAEVQSAGKPDETAAGQAGPGDEAGRAQGGTDSIREEARPTLSLSGQSEAEIRAEQERVAAAEAQRKAEDERAAAAERQARIDAEVAGRQDVAADNFTLTPQVNNKTQQKKADQAEIDRQLAGQGGLFGAPTKSEKQPADPVAETITLYRGVANGKEQVETVGGALFMSPSRAVAQIYAGQDGTITESQHTFRNLLRSSNWQKAKEEVGLPRSASMANLVTAARAQGYDGVSFDTTNGTEYIVIDAGVATIQGGAAADIRNSQTANEAKKDAKGNPIYKMGDRVEYIDGHYQGRHGAISQVSPIRMVTAMLGTGARDEGVTTYYYHVKTDNGADFMASPEEIRFETAKPDSVVPDITVDGMVMEPRRVFDGIGYAKRSAEGSRAAAQRARKASAIADHKRAAERNDAKAEQYQAAWDAWAAKHPDEAEKVAPAAKPAATPAQSGAVASGGDQAAVLKAAGLIVTKGTTNNGKPVWNVSGNTKTHMDIIKRAGGRWYGPKKVWSFYTADPSAAIAAKLPQPGPTIAGTPTIAMSDRGLQQIAASNQPAAEKAKAELEARDKADEVDLGQLFDDVLAEETAPKREAWPGLNEMSQREKMSAKEPRTAGQAAASAAINTGKGLMDAIDGLGKLFGSNGSRLSMGISFDEDTYAKAKPLFAQAVAHFKDAGADLKEAMRAVVRLVLGKFGPQVTENMKPYIVRFMEDVKAGNVVYDETKEADNGNDGTRPATAGTGSGEQRDGGAGETTPTASIAGKPVSEMSDGMLNQIAKGNTEDAGAELTYNRRNRITRGLKWEDVADKNVALRVKEVTKAKVFPKPDYHALVDDGTNPLVAHLVKQVYDAIATVPSMGRRQVATDADMKLYIEAVNRVMDGVQAWATDRAAVAKWAMRQANGAAAAMGKPTNLSDIESVQSLLDTVYPGGWKNYRQEVILLGGNKLLGALQPGYDEVQRATKDIAKGWPGKRESWQQQGYRVLQADDEVVRVKPTNVNGGYFIEVAGKYQTRFPDKASADQAASDLAPWLLLDKRGQIVSGHPSEVAATEAARAVVERKSKAGEIHEKGRAVADAERTGPARRMEGEDISSDRLKDDFGFRGINFGEWMKGDSQSKVAERQLHLNHAYDAFLDLAEILNVPPKAMSLNGMLGLAIGAQGGGKALAHFVPGVNEINLTRTGGAGALAHEWGHALDHYFGTLAGLEREKHPFLTEHASVTRREAVVVDGRMKLQEVALKLELRPEILGRFKAIVAAMTKRAETAAEAKQRLETNAKRYADHVESWLRYIRKEFSGATKPGTANMEAVRAGALMTFDNLAARIGNLDLGEGMVAISRDSAITPVVAEMRDAFKSAFGRFPDVESIKALQANIDGLRAVRDRLKADIEHEPQQVATDYQKTSNAADEGKKKPYWSSKLEMFARAFDAFVVDTLAENAAKNSYLAGIEAVPPLGGERKAINAAFRDLVAEIKTKETDKGVALESRAIQPSSLTGRLGAFLLQDESLDSVESGPDGSGNLGIRRTTGPHGERLVSIPADLLRSANLNSSFAQGGVEVGGVASDFHGNSVDTGTGLVQGDSPLNVVGDGPANVSRSRRSNAATLESGKNGRPMQSTKGVSDLLIGGSLRAHLKRLVEIPGQRISLVKPNMVPSGKDLKIVGGVVHAIPIDMVDVFVSGKTATGKPFSNIPVFVLPSNSLVESVSLLDDVTGASWADKVSGFGHDRTSHINTSKIRSIEQVVKRFMDRFPAAKRLSIEVVWERQDLPTHAVASENAEAIFLDSYGQVFLVASNIYGGDARAFQILLHECIGHFGLAKMMGSRFGGILKEVMRAARAKGSVGEDIYEPGHPDYATIEAVRLRYPKASDEELAQEVLARMAETDPGRTLFGYVRAVVRQWLRDMARAAGINLDVTTAELNDLVAQASRYMRRGDGVAQGVDVDALGVADMAVGGMASKGAAPSAPTFRVVDLFGNGSRVQHFDDKRGLFYEAQKYQSGRTGWRAGEVIDGIDYWLSSKEFGSMEEAQGAVRGLRISNTAKQKHADKYGAIPTLWAGEAKRVAKAIIDAGIGVERFSASTQSASKYVYLDSGLKVRMADHSLPGAYDQPDVDYRYGGDIKALVEKIRQGEEGAPTPDSGELGSRSLGETKMQERPAVRANESGSRAEPAQSGSGAGSDPMLSENVGAGNTAFKAVDTESAEFKRWFEGSAVVDADGKPLNVGGFYIKHSEPLLPKGALEKIHKAYAQGVADKKSGNKTPKWLFSEQDWALTKEQYENRGIEPWAQKYGDPTLNATIYHAVSVAYDAGFKGKRRPELIVGRRLGAVPESGFSFNRRDNEAEQGVSVMGLVDPGGAEYNESTDQVSAMFMRDRNEHYVVGLEHTFRTGADGENLLMVATDLGQVGSQIKSAISNTGAFSATNPSVLESRRGGMESRAAPTSGQPKEPRTGILDTILRKAGGELAAKITGPAYDKLTAFLGGKVPEGIKAGMVSDYGLDEAYVDRRTGMQTEQQKAARQTKTFVEGMMGLDRAQSRVAYQWLNNRGAEADRLMAQLPPESQQVLKDIKIQIAKLTIEAVRLGQLDAETAERNFLAYLHRSYAKYDLNTDDKTWKAERAKAIKILGDQYKGRGLKMDVDPDRIHSAPGWWQDEMKGKRVKVLKNEAGRFAFVADGTAIPPNLSGYKVEGVWEIRARKADNRITLWRDFTQDERTMMGELDEAKYAVARTLFMMNRDIEVGRFHEWVADEYAKTPEEAEEKGLQMADASDSMMRAFTPDEWVTVPTWKIPGTGVFKYGALAGMVVPGPVWNDIRQISAGRFEPFGAAYASILRAWKLSKTALTPTTHVNNIMGNFVMADMHDVGARDAIAAVRLMVAAANGDKDAKAMLDRFEDSGATQGMFTTHELKKEVLEPLLQQLREEVGMADGEAAILKVSAIMSLALHGQFGEAWAGAKAAAKQSTAGRVTGAVVTKAQDYYQAEDSVFRLAAFLKSIDEGKTDLEAGKLSRKAFLDYHINAPWINAMRGTAMPFIAFAYRAIPMLVETAARKPWKIAKYMLVAGGLNALAYAMLGADADEDKERAYLPDEKAGRLWGIVPKLIRMPWNRESKLRDGRTTSDPVFLDVRRWIPVGDVVDYGQDKTALPMIPQPLIPGGPLIMVAEFLVNKSAFTGKELTKETDTWVEKAAKVGGHFYKGFAPNVPIPYSGTWAGTKIDNAVKGKEDPLGRAYPVPEAIASGFGLKLERYPVDTLQRNTVLDMKGKLRELEDERRQAVRDHGRHGMERIELDQKISEIVAKKNKAVEEYKAKERKATGQ